MSFLYPDYVETSAWLEHAPFAFWITEQLQPAMLVELGTHGGFSYFAFCQAVQRLRLKTQCYAVDTWEGDEHAGFYGPEVFGRVQRHNETHYGSFSRLVRSTFDNAREYFTDGTVDLLHVDGRHYYEDVKEDFETWLPKLSQRGVVLFHDVNVREKGFGVFRFWEELSEQYPAFHFLHGHGLGVLAVGPDVEPRLEGLFGSWNELGVRATYSRLGSTISINHELHSLRQDLSATTAQHKKQVQDLQAALTDRDELLKAQASDLEAMRELLKAQASDLEAMREQLKAQGSELETVGEQLAAARDSAAKLEVQRAQREREHRHAVAEARSADAAKRDLAREIRMIERSTSWKITRPVRFVGYRLSQLKMNRVQAAQIGLWLRSGDFDAIRRAARARLEQPSELTSSQQPPSGVDALEELRRGRQAGDLAAADDAVREALLRGEGDHVLLIEAAELSMVRGHWTEACHRWKLAEAAAPAAHRPKIASRFAHAARRDAKYDLAEALCDEVLKHEPVAEPLLREHAEIAMARGDWAGAETRWERLLEAQPSDSSVGLARAGLATCRRACDPEGARDEMRAYLEERGNRSQGGAGPKIAVTTAIVGGYDPLLPPLKLENDVDYVVFSDRAVPGFGVIDVRPTEYFDEDPTRIARYVKTHLHQLLPEYDVVVWMDANVLAVEGVTDCVQRVLNSGHALGALRHPIRDTLWEEAEACLQRGKDDNIAIRKQIERYRHEGLAAHDLIESNFLVMDFRDHRLDEMLATTWSEIDRGSRRDQLSFAYAIAKHSVAWLPMTDANSAVRNHCDFALLDHGTWNTAALAMGDALGGKSHTTLEERKSFLDVRDQRLTTVRSRTVDVIVCVHNALDEVRACLDAVARTRRPEVHRLMVIDDGSEAETASYLRKRLASEANAELFRNEHATGYTRAANLGLRHSSSELVVLLNSDTVVTESWIEKMADAVFATPGAGIVGPLSNAASHQSIPDHASAGSQTAINALPPGHDPESMNALCERWAPSGPLPRVPLVHGFCFGITRTTLETLGTFDEEAFPHGYGEENDYCFRAVDAGIGLVLATNTFVFHVKSSSYESARRVGLMRDGSAQLRKMHGKERIARSVRAMQGNPALTDMRRRSRRLLQQELPRGRPLKLTALVQSPAGYPTSSAYVRLIQPAAALEERVELNLATGPFETFQELGDVVVVQRTAIQSPEGADELVARVRDSRARLVVDIDDGFALIPPKDEAGEAYVRGNRVMERLLKQADAGWFSTPAVASLYRHLNDDVMVLPNGIDPDLWGLPAADASWSPSGRLRFLFMGTFTHGGSLDLLLPAFERLESTHPNTFSLTVVGVAKDVPARPWLHRLDIPEGSNEYPHYVSWLRNSGSFDVGLAPLVDDTFTRCKSDLKFLDYTGLGLLTVASNVPPFARLHSGKDRMVLVDNTVDDWHEQFQCLVNEPTAYAQFVQRARSYVRNERTSKSSSAALLDAIKALDSTLNAS